MYYQRIFFVCWSSKKCKGYNFNCEYDYNLKKYYLDMESIPRNHVRYLYPIILLSLLSLCYFRASGESPLHKHYSHSCKIKCVITLSTTRSRIGFVSFLGSIDKDFFWARNFFSNLGYLLLIFHANCPKIQFDYCLSHSFILQVIGVFKDGTILLFFNFKISPLFGERNHKLQKLLPGLLPLYIH